MAEENIDTRINALAREEHEIFERESRGTATDADRKRLRLIQITLDQCWDLLRQRRARQEFGLDPDKASLRDAKTVEGYTD